MPLIVSVGGWSPRRVCGGRRPHRGARERARDRAERLLPERGEWMHLDRDGRLRDPCAGRALPRRDRPAGARQALPERGRHRGHCRSRCRRRSGGFGGREHLAGNRPRPRDIATTARRRRGRAVRTRRSSRSACMRFTAFSSAPDSRWRAWEAWRQPPTWSNISLLARPLWASARHCLETPSCHSRSWGRCPSSWHDAN